MEKRQKIKSLEAIRAIAFVAVCLSHSEIKTFCSMGHWATSIFLILSGFVTALSTSSKTIKPSFKKNIKYMYNRIKKIYPLHIVATLFMSVFSFLGTVKDSIGIFSLKLLLNVFLVQEWIPILSRSINVVSWFLCVETFSFFVLPWVIKKQKTVPTIKASIVVLIIVEYIIALIAKKMPLNIYSEIIYEQYDIIEWFVYRFPLFRFVDVLLGYYIGSLYLTNNNKQIKNATQKEIIVCIINVVVIIISAYYHISPYNDSVIQIQNVWWNHVVVFTPASLMLIYLFAFEEGAISKSIANKKIIKIAELSPYAFLIQYPINIYFSYTLTYVCKITNIELGCDKLITLIISISISLVLSNIWNKSTKKIRTINNVLW